MRQVYSNELQKRHAVSPDANALRTRMQCHFRFEKFKLVISFGNKSSGFATAAIHFSSECG